MNLFFSLNAHYLTVVVHVSHYFWHHECRLCQWRQLAVYVQHRPPEVAVQYWWQLLAT